MSAPRVLISGASVAGPALAWWMARNGWSVTVVERFDGPREGGHNVDVRGAAREVLRRMALEDLGRADQVRLLCGTFAGVGWETDRVLDALDEVPFVFDTIGQVRLPTWSSGRVALLGDTAYCASPLSGMGTSLALVGAYVLAGELTRRDHHRDAFAAYERLMRPWSRRSRSSRPECSK